MKPLNLCKCGQPRRDRDSSCKACAKAYYVEWSAAVAARLEAK